MIDYLLSFSPVNGNTRVGTNQPTVSAPDTVFRTFHV